MQYQSRRSITRDTRTGRKCDLGRYLGSIDWSVVDSATNCCESKLQLFQDLVKIGLDNILALKTFKIHVNDAPWVTAEFKATLSVIGFVVTSLIVSGSCVAANTIIPNQWWKEIKIIAGMAATTGRGDIRSQLHLDGIADSSNLDMTNLNLINTALLEPMQAYNPLACLPPAIDSSEALIFNSSEVCNALLGLHPRPRFPRVCNGELVICCTEATSSLAKMLLTFHRWWKRNLLLLLTSTYDPCPLPNALSKLAEDFAVNKYLGAAVLEVIDSNQYSAIPKTSTLHAFISIIHTWLQATDGTGSAVRVVLLDYRKAIDLVNQSILAAKILELRASLRDCSWVCGFRMDLRQRVKLSNDCFSGWDAVPSGVPQGPKLGLWLFLLMNNDVRLSGSYLKISHLNLILYTNVD